MKYCVGLPDYVFEFDDTSDNFRTWLEANAGKEELSWRYIPGVPGIDKHVRGVCFSNEDDLTVFTTTFNIMGHR